MCSSVVKQLTDILSWTRPLCQAFRTDTAEYTTVGILNIPGYQTSAGVIRFPLTAPALNGVTLQRFLKTGVLQNVGARWSRLVI